MDLITMFLLNILLLGLLIGSFLNVAAIRIPNGQSISFPPSHCVHCKHRLAPWDLNPVLSYLMLKGKCRYCGQRISAKYPIWEAIAAASFVWVGVHFGPLNLEWAAGLLLASILIVITRTDLSHMIIPDKVVFTGVALAVILRLFQHPLPIWNYAAAAAIGFIILYLLAVVSRGGMGGGDIKLYLFIGLMLGIKLTLLSLFLASILGAIYGIGNIIVRRGDGKQPIPFGPFIALGSFLAFLYGDEWVELYLSIFFAA